VLQPNAVAFEDARISEADVKFARSLGPIHRAMLACRRVW
jgi:hypothetical protein